MSKHMAEIVRCEQCLWESLFSHNRLLFFATIVVRLLLGLLNLGFSYLLMQLIDTAAEGSLDKFVSIVFETIALIVFEFILMAARSFLMPRYLQVAIDNYRNVATDFILKKKPESFRESGLSPLASMLTNDVTVIRDSYLSKVFMLISESIVFLGALILLFQQSPLLLLVALATSVISLASGTLFSNKLARYEKTQSEDAGRLIATIKEIIAGFPLIKAYGAEIQGAKIIRRSGKKLESSRFKVERTQLQIELVGSTGYNISQFSVFLVGTWLCLTGRGITAGGILFCAQLINYIAQPLQVIPPVLAARKASRSLVHTLAEAIFENHDDVKRIQLPQHSTNTISLHNVSYAYSDTETVLKNVTFSFEPNKSYAIVGASGSGKSTLLLLLMGSLENYDGSIIFDGIELSKVDLSSLYRRVALVRQDNFIFNGSLRDNVTMFSDFSEQQINLAIQKAGLTSFVNEHGFDWNCGENGAALSGGERQRICIARALVRGTQVLLLDEATSALDQNVADHIMQSILDLHDTLRIVVTHRLEGSQLAQFDCILALRDGKLVETGSFDALMKKDGYFKGLYTVGRL